MAKIQCRYLFDKFHRLLTERLEDSHLSSQDTEKLNDNSQDTQNSHNNRQDTQNLKDESQSSQKFNDNPQNTRNLTDLEVGMIDSERRSIQSENSEDLCTWQVNAQVRDLDGKTWTLPVLVDTQSPKSFISRGTYSEIGPFKERPIPDSKRDTFSGPFGNDLIEPQSFINVWLEFQGIELQNMEARLRIMEGADKFGVLLGRDFIFKYKKKTDTSLLLLLEDTIDNTSSPNTSPTLIGALISKKKTQKQETIDEELRLKFEQDRRALHGSMLGLAFDPSRASTTIDSARTPWSNIKSDARPIPAMYAPSLQGTISTCESYPVHSAMPSVFHVELRWFNRTGG
ncbi:hypothetical protein EG329_013634 [Mollisiaceae sp. DMI_Dod_QoI]|nr:hypothetical protein EG329_013634 [Helotiales sp. DMI_Dod_QoI]